VERRLPPCGAERYEDLTTGAARFAADLYQGASVLGFVRSTQAHARIATLDVSAAAAIPGVRAVFTAADLDLEPIWEITIVPEAMAQPPLALDEVRYVGERVVAIVADDLATVLDAVEAVVVEYEPRPHRLGCDPTPELGPSSVALRWDERAGSYRRAADDATVTGQVEMPRVAVAPMEGLAVVAVPSHDGLTLYASTQCPGAVRIQTARSLRIPLDAVRVVTPHVGGAFGGKSLGGVPGYVVAAAAARRLDTPVRYVEDRTANLVTMHGRGVALSYAAVASNDGRLRELRIDEVCDAGAYPSTNAVEPGKTHFMACGPYGIAALRFTARSILTNAAPSGAYRGPGRAEATMVLEQALDRIGHARGIDPVEMRRRNLVPAAELPHRSPGGAVLVDSDFGALLDLVVERSHHDRWRARQRAARAAGATPALGVGLALAVDSSAWFERRESVVAEIDADGRIAVHVATASAGQDHATAFERCVATALDLEPGSVRVVEGDTLLVSGPGSSGSRTTQIAGSAVFEVAQVLAGLVREAAATLLEAAVDDVVVEAGRLLVRGTPARGLELRELVAQAGPIRAEATFEQLEPTHPSAAMVAIVEVDRDTGSVRPIEVHVAVDCGTVVDPPAAEGQVVGAVAQAIGQVLHEQASFDDAGTPLAATLAEYLLPGPTELPPVHVHFRPVAAASNPIGAKGVGEVGMVVGPAALLAAVKDALGGPHVDLELPCTPERIWRALHATPDRITPDRAGGRRVPFFDVDVDGR
jgi:carbon-monoxide dehydrogenase large subunit